MSAGHHTKKILAKGNSANKSRPMGKRANTGKPKRKPQKSKPQKKGRLKGKSPKKKLAGNKSPKKALPREEKKKIRAKVKKNEKMIATMCGKSEYKLMTSTMLKYKVALILLEQKQLVEKLGKSWPEYREKKFPYIAKKKDERYRRVAGYIDMKEDPVLAYLSFDTLTELILKAKKLAEKNEQPKSIPELLEEYGLDLDEIDKLNSPKEVQGFKGRRKGSNHKDARRYQGHVGR